MYATIVDRLRVRDPRRRTEVEMSTVATGTEIQPFHFEISEDH
jgi:hypothetical protein